MAETISNKAIAVLIVVTILVTVAGTLLFEQGVNDFVKYSQKDTEGGEAYLFVHGAPMARTVYEVPDKGQVSLEVNY